MHLFPDDEGNEKKDFVLHLFIAKFQEKSENLLAYIGQTSE